MFIDDIQVLIEIGVLSEYLFVALSIAGLLYLRKARPNAPRPIRVSEIEKPGESASFFRMKINLSIH
jgi:hypothetical protein